MEVHSHPLLAITGLFGLGLLHGVGPDHLAALGTLASRKGSLREAVAVAIRFGAGHAGVLAAGAAASLALGFVIPEAFERAAEIFGGSIVALLGAAAVVEALGVRAHRHSHGEDAAHAHLHVHVGREHDHRDGHGHRHGATLVGALLAVSGLRGLLLLLPAAATRSPAVLGGAVVAFGAGVVLSMIAAALAGAGAVWLGGRSGMRVGGRWATGLVGAASFSVGVAWCIAAW